jgi:PHS family inorganic phosphate transporter-like MFS transporter
LGLNSSIILQAIGFGAAPTKGTQGVFDNLHNICVGNLILSAAGLIPGYYFSFAFIDFWGRKPIQLMGFTILTILFMTMGSLPPHSSNNVSY